MTIAGTTATTYTIGNLSSATWYFGVKSPTPPAARERHVQCREQDDSSECFNTER